MSEFVDTAFKCFEALDDSSTASSNGTDTDPDTGRAASKPATAEDTATAEDSGKGMDSGKGTNTPATEEGISTGKASVGGIDGRGLTSDGRGLTSDGRDLTPASFRRRLAELLICIGCLRRHSLELQFLNGEDKTRLKILVGYAADNGGHLEPQQVDALWKAYPL